MTSKINFYFTIIELLKEGNTISDISKKLSIPKQNLYYYTRTLKELGFIEKKGYGTWEVKRSKKDDLEHTLKWRDKSIRGHAFIWKIKSKKFNWIEILDRKKIQYKLIRGYIPRIFIKDKKIWLAKNSIIIYETKSFFGKNATQSRKYAIFELLETLRALSNKLDISLGRYYFKPTREHYGLIKNELARQCNKNGEKIIVRDDIDGDWLWIDDSEGMLGELETGGKGISQDRASLNLDVQKWYNDHKKHNFKVTPTFILETMNGIQKNQMIFDANMSSHLEVLENIGKAITELKNEVKKLKR